jgi:putative oxidoreductase
MSDLAGAIVLVGRVLFAVLFVNGGLGFHVRQSAQAEGYARSVGFPLASIAGWPTGLWMTAGGLSLALGIWPDIGALMIGLFLAVAALNFHRFWQLEDQMQKMTQNQLFFRNLMGFGAVLMMFGLFATLGDGLRYTITPPLFSF